MPNDSEFLQQQRQRQNGSDIRHVSSTGHMRRSNSDSNTQQQLQDGAAAASPSSSCWNTDSTTPMTTRPHFPKRTPLSPTEDHQQHYPIRRIRSRSLGAEIEAARHKDWRMLNLPILSYSTTISATTEPTSHIQSTETTQLPPIQQQQQQHDPYHLPITETTTLINGKSASTNTSTPDSITTTPPTPKQQQPHHHHTGTESTPIWISIMYGMINATIVLPVLMSFGSIIYRNQAFAPYQPVLVKMTVASGIVHQLCFSTFSSLPFAVGQVQDAGLIFLSSMASRIVDACNDKAQQQPYDTLASNHGDDDDDTPSSFGTTTTTMPSCGQDAESLLATVTVMLAIGTAILGLGLMCIGKWKLAQYVQFLPTSVVGGYLAYIGWFCGMAGIGLMAGSDEMNLPVILRKFQFIGPGILGGLMIYVSVRRLRHMAVLPVSILCLILIFYLILWWTGTSVADATDKGWIREMDDAPVWYHTWDFLKFNKVDWSVLSSSLIVTELSMIFVVALSSSLDVAAIELELNRPLNYNHELMTVGLSNVVSGMTGGYTGSYIFSQSIFSLRAGIRSRLAGYVLAICQIVFFVLPFPVLAYVPSFFFGSLLSMICIDLMFEWLWDVRTRVTPVEYVICLSTFGLIQLLGVEYGIIAGVALYVACLKLGLDVGELKIWSMQPESDKVDDDDDDDDDAGDDNYEDDEEVTVSTENISMRLVPSSTTANGFADNNYGAIS